MEMSKPYDILLIKRNEMHDHEESLNAHLSSIFGKDSELIINEEFESAVVIRHFNDVIASGVAYSRTMKQGSVNFKAGIIGGVGVTHDYRHQGLSKIIVEELDKHLAYLGTAHSFLFAYNTNIYRSSGYNELTSPIHFFDQNKKRWDLFVYRGGMCKSYCQHQLDIQVIEFNGCIY